MVISPIHLLIVDIHFNRIPVFVGIQDQIVRYFFTDIYWSLDHFPGLFVIITYFNSGIIRKIDF